MASATSIYASSISRNTMKATAAAVGLAAGFAGVIAAVAASITANLDQAFANLPEKWAATDAGMPSWAPSQELMTGLAVAFLAVIVLGFGAGLLWLGGRNCRRQVVPARDVVRQFAGMSLGLVALLGVCGAISAQLMLLKQREVWFEQRQSQREVLLAALQSFARSGKLTPETYRQFNVPTNAPIETLRDAIFESRGPNGVNELARILNPPAKPAGAALDPAMARRYGLVPGALRASTNAIAPQQDAKSAAAVFSMDPAMARRYGLTPKTNAAPAR